MYKALLDGLDFFTLDVTLVLPSNCVKPGGTTYYDALFLMTVGPLVIILVVLVASVLSLIHI